jgi:acyl carrier protein
MVLKDVIFEKVKELMISEFKVAAESIGLEKRLDEDLDLDSLDAVDLIIALQDHIGEKVDPSLFKDVRTVRDVVDLLQPLWKEL